jgi:hypothetical protein
MNLIIKKGRLSSTVLFITTGLFLVVSFGYQLVTYLNTNDFVTTFPGDWDKPLGILVGIFLIFRSKRFENQRKGLFVELEKNKLQFRTRESEKTQRINLKDIDKVYATEDGINIKTKDNHQVILYLKSIKSEKEMKELRKKLIELISEKVSKM